MARIAVVIPEDLLVADVVCMADAILVVLLTLTLLLRIPRIEEDAVVNMDVVVVLAVHTKDEEQDAVIPVEAKEDEDTVEDMDEARIVINKICFMSKINNNHIRMNIINKRRRNNSMLLSPMFHLRVVVTRNIMKNNTGWMIIISDRRRKYNKRRRMKP